ncbi:MAG: peptidyl-prolyl cis-trans isomerase [Pyrinomonadaceae bacterium]|nr:peptidyl-prolyl cis-trans isomerase [Pyrinomonadaceae bacterium]
MERTRNFVLLIFSIVMVASLILFYAPTRDIGTDLTRNEETIAKVSGEIITVSEVARQQETMSQFGRSMPAKFMLDGMIRERIIRVEADRLGLTATDAEVASRIREQFKSEDTPFDQKRYEDNVTRQFGSVVAYEQIVRDEISGQKLEAYLTSGVTVSENEVLEDFKRKNTKFDLTYVPVTVNDLAATLKPSDEELQAYFEKNKQSYYISSPQKKVRYIFLNTAKIGEKLNITDADLQAEFDKLPADKRIAGVEGQQIVLRVSKPEFEQQVLEKANQLVAQARKDNGKISEEAFAEIAKGQSEDAATAQKGGKIPGLVRENPSNPTDPYQRLLTLQPGEVSEPIKYENRYFILRRGEAVAKSLETAKKELEVSLRNRKAYTAAADLANKVAESLKAEKDVNKVAAQYAAQANMSVDNMVKETGYVKPGDDVKDIGISEQFEQGIASLENPNDVGDKIPVPNGFAIPLLVEKKEPRDAELSEVRERVLEAVKLEQARAKAGDIAKQIAANANNAGGLSAAAQAANLKAQESKSFVVGSPLGQGPTATTSEALENAIYGMKEGDVTKEPVSIGENWFIVGVNNREEASMEDFAKQRDQLTQSMLQTKRATVYSDYLASRQREMEAAGKIVVYKELLAQLDAIPSNNQPSQQEILQQQIQQQLMQQQEQPAPPNQ